MSELKLISMTDSELEAFAESIAEKTAKRTAQLVASAKPDKGLPPEGVGLEALSIAAGLSRCQVSKLKQRGVFDGAISGSEKKFIVDIPKARELYFEYRRKVRKGIIKA